MGLLDRLGIIAKDNSKPFPKGVDPKSIPPATMAKDLARLQEYENRIKGGISVSSNKSKIESPHDLALKLKNPFRGV